ncbi:MAG: DUF6144 family protein, partial [Candidatus Hodarchaeota archaeon]
VIEVGFPVTQAVETDEIHSRIFEAHEVLSVLCKGDKYTPEQLNAAYGKAYDYMLSHGLAPQLLPIQTEIFHDANNPEGKEIEIHINLKNWNNQLANGVEEVLGEDARKEVMEGSEKLTPESSLDERVQWLKGAMERLDSIANEEEKYDAVSRCAHTFAKERIEELSTVYTNTKDETNDSLKAIDAVIAFMAEDPGWYEAPRREGYTLYSKKGPFNPQDFEKATTETEKKIAYCHCPMVRNRLDAGVPVTFCNCGAGWYRQEWEGAIGKPVKIEILKSLLLGDSMCEFAIHLPEDL